MRLLRVRRLVSAAAFGGVVVAFGLAGTDPSPAPTAVTRIPALSGLTDSARLATPEVLAGRLTLRPGGPPVSGAVVYLQAWPSQEVLADMQPGDPFDMRPIAKGITDETGRYVLRLDPRVDLAGLKTADGQVDVEVVSVSGHDWNVTTTSLGSAGSAASARLALALHGQVGTADAVESEPRVAAGRVPTADGLEPVGHYNGSCPGGDGLKKRHNGRWVHVGDIHIAAGGKKMKFTYTDGSSSTLGVGISTTGAYNSWSASGSVNQKTTDSSVTTVSWPWFASGGTHRMLDTQFDYGKFCVEYYDSMHGTGHYYKERSVKHQGGTRDRGSAKPTAKHCTQYRTPGSGGSKKETNAITWTDGAKLEGIIGIDLSARTGFRTSNKIRFEFPKPGRLCGTHGRPGDTPRRLVMKKKNW